MKCSLCGKDKPTSAFDLCETEHEHPVCWECVENSNFNLRTRLAMVGFVVFITAIGIGAKLYFGGLI